MSRKPRIDFPGAWHYVMHCGVRRASIFKKDAHCSLFLDILEEVAYAFELEIHAYSLMPNQYHLLVYSRHGNLSRAMKHLNAAYTQMVNLLEHRDGPIFRGRFKSRLIDDETNLPYLLADIHLNPLKAGLITRLDSHCRTSHRAYLGKDSTPAWLTKSYFETVFKDSDELHRYVLDLHRGKIIRPDQSATAGGRLKEKRERAARVLAGNVETRFLTSKEALDRICDITGVELNRLCMVEYGPRANPARRFAVWALKRRTQLTHAEIGKQLNMSESQVSHVLRRIRPKEEPMAAWMEKW